MSDKRLDETQWTQIYRCACGCDIDLGNAPTECDKCKRAISLTAKSDLSMTVTIGSITNPASGLDKSSNVQDDLIGEHLGHFKILSPLGAGGMGQVYRALDTSLQRFVAVKVLRNRDIRLAAEDANEHLLQEAVAQARVNHGNVVTIYYVGRHEGNAFLAMELVGDETLASRLKTGPLPYDEVSSIALQVADALKNSCEMGIVHGDIKPNNILLSQIGLAKLSDFGMSRKLDEKHQNQSVGGTPNYLAPELLEGGQPSVQSDMYALGVTLFEMTFGRLPVQMSGSSVVSWRESHARTKIQFPNPLPPNIPVKWTQLLARLLDKDPSRRYGDYSELLDELRRIQPRTSSPARALPRIIAWLFDLTLNALLMVPFGALVAILNQAGDGDIIANNNIGAIAMTFPAAIHLFVLCWWKQSIGRHLMSIRVVNRYGLPPSRTVLIARESFRLYPIWFSLLSTMALGPDSIVNALFMAFLGILLFVSCVVAAFNRKGLTLHDMVCKTRVILDAPN